MVELIKLENDCLIELNLRYMRTWNCNWWEMNFQVLQFGEGYKVQILSEEMESIIIALVVAIDCVKAIKRLLPNQL